MISERELVLVSLGSNLGDPIGQIERAIGFLQSLAVGRVVVSSLWHSVPVGCGEGVPFFHNAAVGLRLDEGIGGEGFLNLLQGYEIGAGRPLEHGVNRARVIDLDVIYFRGMVLKLKRLVVPHPRAMGRRFVMEPLAEIVPWLRFGGGRTVAEVAEGLRVSAPEQGVERCFCRGGV